MYSTVLDKGEACLNWKIKRKISIHIVLMLLSNDQNEVEEEQAIKKNDMTPCVDLKRDAFLTRAGSSEEGKRRGTGGTGTTPTYN